jgi:hypothetical protein
VVYLVHSQHGVDRSFHTITRDGSARNEAEYSVASPHPDLHTCNGRCGGGERMRSLPLQILTSSFFVIKSINYIHLTAEYKLPILSLKRLKLYTNTIKITILEYKNDLFSA